MTICVNPECPSPQNSPTSRFCVSCGSPLLLKERYRPIQKIGEGGFGRTFLAIDEDIPSQPGCVVKQLYLESDRGQSRDKKIELFRKEAVRLDQLGKHPQIPTLLAHFEQNQQLYLVQELIEGHDLAQELEQNGTFREEQIWELLQSMLPLLQFVHQRRVIHRDIKPSNIMRRHSNGQLLLIDFGIAKLITATSLQQTGTMVGTPAYVAPEQLRGKARPASDLYSLGVTCVHLLTNISSPLDLYDIVEAKWAWRDYLLPDNQVSDALGRILDKLLQDSLTKRYQTASEVEEVLKPPQTIAAIPKVSQKPVHPNHLLTTVTYVKSLLKPLENQVLPAESELDYSKLASLLVWKRWQAADLETWSLLSQASGKGLKGYLLAGDIDKIPCEDLQAIDRLWVERSGGRFGFTVQAQIYWQVGEDYLSFCDRVGWPVYQPHNSHKGLRFNLKAPPGHLPSRVWVGGVKRWNHAEAMVAKLTKCGIV
ncbi:MAG: GUN4 domain-containing protein [Hormoscilla sp.]